MVDLQDDSMCFVCGEKNSIGLKLKFETEGNKTKAVFIPKKEHQGYQDIVHGGILSTILDEAMTRLGYKLGLNTVTAKMEVNFRKPAYVGEKLFLEGEITKEEERKVFAKSKLTKEDGTLIADAEGILVKIKPKE
jgi:uncharacterized protein (TIGR00369 family)